MLTVAAFYHFARLPDPASRRAPLLALARQADVRGSVLLAPEGVNGTIAGTTEGVAAVLAHLRDWPGFQTLGHKESPAADPPFGRLKVRLKREIVTMGVPDLDPSRSVGTYVAPQDWNALISAPDVVVIDTRNDYEVGIGSFQGAIDPRTRTFGEFPGWWQANRDRLAGRRVAMFCTGGIRCEKATSYLVSQGVKDVFHLRGGILKYLEEVPAEASLWQGECFVFDGRVSVGHGLAPGDLSACGACRRPVPPGAKTHPAYEEGVGCPACEAEFGPDDRARFRERQRQMQLARARGTRHLGA